jgi:hypothetical protein
MEHQLDQYATVLAQLLEKKEKYQLRVGEIVYNATQELGPSAIEEISERVKELEGRTFATSTLRNYRWCYDRTHKLNLPDDISYRVRQLIAASDNPLAWAERIIEEGLSSLQVARLFAVAKPKKLCPHCGKPLN